MLLLVVRVKAHQADDKGTNIHYGRKWSGHPKTATFLTFTTQRGHTLSRPDVLSGRSAAVRLCPHGSFRSVWSSHGSYSECGSASMTFNHSVNQSINNPYCTSICLPSMAGPLSLCSALLPSPSPSPSPCRASAGFTVLHSLIAQIGKWMRFLEVAIPVKAGTSGSGIQLVKRVAADQGFV
jgi:hypothetical protein